MRGVSATKVKVLTLFSGVMSVESGCIACATISGKNVQLANIQEKVKTKKIEDLIALSVKEKKNLASPCKF